METVILTYKGKRYVLSFDEYDTLDTVECEGKLLVSTNSACRFFITHQHKIFGYDPVDGVKYQ